MLKPVETVAASPESPELVLLSQIRQELRELLAKNAPADVEKVLAAVHAAAERAAAGSPAPTAKGHRVDFARRLLDQRLARPLIRDRVMARFRVSRAEAYRVIELALKRRNETVSENETNAD